MGCVRNIGTTRSSSRSEPFRRWGPLFCFQAEGGIRDDLVTGVQTCALPISFSHVAEARGLRFGFTLDDDLPGAIYTDAKRLQQVIKNLLSNAFKFTEDGGVDVRIAKVRGGWSEDNESLSRAGDGVLAVSCTDTGIGI